MEEERRVKLPTKSITMVKPTFKKVQVVYYISKNGQLEHPHIVEVTHLVHHQLRLKDVLERLSALRGRGMPYLYSWSCKRMYKNGYVWNDLGVNDVILPSEGQEYVLKASQLVFHSPDNPLHVNDETQMHVPKRKPMTPKQHTEFNEEELDFEEKRINYSNPPSKRGINRNSPTLSPPSPPPSTISGDSNCTSKRFEDGDPYPPLSRNSVLLHLMACGGSIGFKGKSDNNIINQTTNVAAARKSCSSSGSLHKGVLCKKAATVAVEDEICCMSENPRFGKMQAEEREYFSGSIVEAMAEERVQVEPMLNKSSSYTEERVSKTTLSMAGEEDDEKKREKTVAGKCIPKRFC